jgi:hypothetical protein
VTIDIQEDDMRKQVFIPILVGILALSAAQAFAQTATVVMRNGDRVRADVLDMGRSFAFNINGQLQRVPIADVVLLDFAGDGRNIPVDELNKANAANGYVVMRNGEQFNARLQDFTGKPLIAVFSGGRRTNLSDVSRIYMSSIANVAGFPALTTPAATGTSGQQQPAPAPDRPSEAPRRARQVVVPGNVLWTNTGFTVSRGQMLRFEPSGEIRLSFNGEDIARPAGALSFRFAPQAPIPTIPVGALIGRIGNGQPFSIGDTTQAFDMPDTGRLFLGINDDHVADNSGNFVVRVWEP